MPKCPFCNLRTETGDELTEHFAHKHPEEIVDTGSSRNNQRRRSKKKSKSKPIVVDGNNVSYSNGNMPQLSLLKRARAALMKLGYHPIIFVSAALRHSIDEAMELNRLINLGWIIEVEGGLDDDRKILEEAQRKGCPIVSNDRYSEYHADFTDTKWDLKKAVKTFAFKDGKFILN